MASSQKGKNDSLTSAVHYNDGAGGHIPAVVIGPIDSSGNPSSVRVSPGGPAPGQSVNNFSSSGGDAGNTTRNLYTVTTGKTGRVTDINISTDDTTARLVQLLAGATVIFEDLVVSGAPLRLPDLASKPSAASAVVLALVLPAPTSGKKFYWYVGTMEQ